MSKSILSFLTAILFSAIALVFTMVGVTNGDDVALSIGYIMSFAWIIMFAVGLILTMKGEWYEKNYINNSSSIVF